LFAKAGIEVMATSSSGPLSITVFAQNNNIFSLSLSQYFPCLPLVVDKDAGRW
jgi:hypothetical protein